MPSELDVQIRMTKAFIATRPVDITLRPHAMAADGTGGRKLLPTAGVRPPQTMRFVEEGGGTRSVTTEGAVTSQRATLIALPDAHISVNDQFEWDGKTWRVEDVHFPNNYEKRATVVEHGR